MSYVRTTKERRDFSRVPISRRASVEVNGRRTACKLVDISLCGALLHVPPAVHAIRGQACVVDIYLDDAFSQIQMRGLVAHFTAGVLGVRCRLIDIDSIAHLRRLLELNFLHERMLHREISALVAHHRK